MGTDQYCRGPVIAWLTHDGGSLDHRQREADAAAADITPPPPAKRRTPGGGR